MQTHECSDKKDDPELREPCVWKKAPLGAVENHDHGTKVVLKHQEVTRNTERRTRTIHHERHNDRNSTWIDIDVESTAQRK